MELYDATELYEDFEHLSSLEDSNGSIVTSGGTVWVYGSSNDGNAARDLGDRGGSWTTSGAIVLAVGHSGMAAVPSSGAYVAFGGMEAWADSADLVSRRVDS